MYAVNFNGTEDWAELPDGAVRLDDGTAAFEDQQVALAFGEKVARDAIRFMETEGGDSHGDAVASLHSVPVQLIDLATGGVVMEIAPETL